MTRSRSDLDEATEAEAISRSINIFVLTPGANHHQKLWTRCLKSLVDSMDRRRKVQHARDCTVPPWSPWSISGQSLHHAHAKCLIDHAIQVENNNEPQLSHSHVQI